MLAAPYGLNRKDQLLGLIFARIEFGLNSLPERGRLVGGLSSCRAGQIAERGVVNDPPRDRMLWGTRPFLNNFLFNQNQVKRVL